MKNFYKSLVLLVSMVTMLPLHAANNSNKQVVLQISDSDPFKQTLVLNVANNLIKHYGEGRVDIEIVAFGPGLRLLFEKNVNSGRISNLAAKEVTFSACENTIAGMTKILGHAPTLNSDSRTVPGGVVRIIDLVEEGYQLIKP